MHDARSVTERSDEREELYNRVEALRALDRQVSLAADRESRVRSVGVSPSSAALDEQYVSLWLRATGGPEGVRSMGTVVLVRFGPSLPLSSANAPEPGPVGPARPRLARAIESAIESEDVETGIAHPAEDLLIAAWSESPPSLAAWVLELIRDPRAPSLAASVLRLAGRALRTQDSAAREAWVRASLASPNVELRDAAVRAVESWEDGALARVLREHEERVPWLRDYLDSVLEEIEQGGSP